MSPAEPRLVDLAMVREAAERIRGHVLRTPLLPAEWARPGEPLWLKPESLQPTGAFKLRGAVNAVARLPSTARGVVTHSSGNHGQSLARAAREAGLPAVVVVPEDTPAVKVAATRAQGAEVVVVPAAERLRTAQRLGEERGYVLVPPFDHPDVIAGQGTIGLEIVADLPDVALVLVPVSGAGLVSGIAVAVKALAPGARVVGVEPELAGDLAEGRALGRRVEWASERTGRTIADSLRVAGVSELTWAHVQAYVDDVVTVPEDALRDAVRVLAQRSRLVVEPGGAAAVAAYLTGAAGAAGGPAVAVVSGGNLDPALLGELLAAGAGTPT